MPTEQTTPDTDDEQPPMTESYPENLQPENLTETQRGLIQAVYQDPGESGTWYTDKVGCYRQAMGVMYKNYPRLLNREKDPSDGRVQLYELTGDAIAALSERGIIDRDGVSDLQNKAEEPSQRHKIQRGNITYEGPALDIAGDDDAQTILDRPVKDEQPEDKNCDHGEPSVSETSNGATDSDIMAAVMDTTGNTDGTGNADGLSFELSRDTAFELLRSADESAARELFDQMAE